MYKSGDFFCNTYFGNFGLAKDNLSFFKTFVHKTIAEKIFHLELICKQILFGFLQQDDSLLIPF